MNRFFVDMYNIQIFANISTVCSHSKIKTKNFYVIICNWLQNSSIWKQLYSEQRRHTFGGSWNIISRHYNCKINHLVDSSIKVK